MLRAENIINIDYRFILPEAHRVNLNGVFPFLKESLYVKHSKCYWLLKEHCTIGTAAAADASM